MDLMEMHLNLRAKNEKENIASGLVKTTLANAFEDLSIQTYKPLKNMIENDCKDDTEDN